MARLLNRAFREPKQIRGVLWISYSAAGAGASPKKAGSNWTSRRDRERAPDGSRGIRNQVSGLISRTSQSSGTGISRPSARTRDGLWPLTARKGRSTRSPGRAQENDRTPFRASRWSKWTMLPELVSSRNVW